MSLFTVSPYVDCLNAGKSLVAVTAVHSTVTHVYELDDTAGAQLNVATVAAFSPPPGVAPPLPPEPILPSSSEPPPVACGGENGAGGGGDGHDRGGDGDDSSGRVQLPELSVRPPRSPRSRGGSQFRQVAFSTDLLAPEAPKSKPTKPAAAVAEGLGEAQESQCSFLPSLAIWEEEEEEEQQVEAAAQLPPPGPRASSAQLSVGQRPPPAAGRPASD